MTELQYQAELEKHQRNLADLERQAKAQQEKANRIARQFLQIASEHNLSIADMEQALNVVKSFQRVHARVVFDPDVFDAWASPKDIFSLGKANAKGMTLLD